jgi:hypothetical protein
LKKHFTKKKELVEWFKVYAEFKLQYHKKKKTICLSLLSDKITGMYHYTWLLELHAC